MSIATKSRQSFVFLITVLSFIMALGVIASAKSGGNPNAGCDESQNSDTGHGANQGDAYDSTCDGSASENGNGGGDGGGKPCAGCVGNADDKNPPGQGPDGSDSNNGYECDGNGGVGKTNPAHTGCVTPTTTTTDSTPSPSPTPGATVVPSPTPTGDDNATPSPTPGSETPSPTPGGVSPSPTITPSVEPTFLTPAPTRRPPAPSRPPRPQATTPPSVRGKRLLPFTGDEPGGALVLAGLLMAAGGAAMLLSYQDRPSGARR